MKAFRISMVLKSKGGFTLIECVISLLIFSIVTVLFAVMFTTANLLTQKAQDMDNALDEVINKVETGAGASPGAAQEITFTFSNGSGGQISVPANIKINSYKDKNNKITMKDFDAVP